MALPLGPLRGPDSEGSEGSKGSEGCGIALRAMNMKSALRDISHPAVIAFTTLLHNPQAVRKRRAVAPARQRRAPPLAFGNTAKRQAGISAALPADWYLPAYESISACTEILRCAQDDRRQAGSLMSEGLRAFENTVRRTAVSPSH